MLKRLKAALNTWKMSPENLNVLCRARYFSNFTGFFTYLIKQNNKLLHPLYISDGGFGVKLKTGLIIRSPSNLQKTVLTKINREDLLQSGQCLHRV